MGQSTVHPTTSISTRRPASVRSWPDSVSSRALLTADLGRLGPGIESHLPGAASYSHCRPCGPPPPTAYCLRSSHTTSRRVCAATSFYISVALVECSASVGPGWHPAGVADILCYISAHRSQQSHRQKASVAGCGRAPPRHLHPDCQARLSFRGSKELGPPEDGRRS